MMISHFIPAMWSLDAAFNNTKNVVHDYGAKFLLILGVCILVYGGVMLFKAITGRTGSTGPHWGKVVLSIIVGGTMAASGGIMYGLGQLGTDLINKIGNDIVPTQSVHMDQQHDDALKITFNDVK